jgi:hypothetical protein
METNGYRHDSAGSSVREGKEFEGGFCELGRKMVGNVPLPWLLIPQIQQRGNAGTLIASRAPPRPPISTTPDLLHTPRASPLSSAVLAATASGHGRSRPAPAALNLDNAEGIELLTESEVQLCSMLRIMPHAYLAIKDKMVGECQRTGGLRKRHARELIKIDVNKTSRLWDYFCEQRWICGLERFKVSFLAS